MTVDPNNTEFQRAFDLVANTTRNVFLTGRAGTGKTTFLKYLKEKCCKSMAIVAPTGVAAVNAGGVTIHSLFQIKPGFNEPKTLPAYDLSRQKQDVLKGLELLVIDEVSMVRCDLLEMVEKTCRHYGNRQLPFGGKQVLFIGDPYQLPPVVGQDDKDVFYRFYSSPFFFKSTTFWSANPIPVELKKIYRQNDAAFIDLLNRVRVNEVKESDLQTLLQKVVGLNYPFAREKYLYLATKNDPIKRVNEKELAALPGKEYVFTGQITGQFDKYQLPTDFELCLKEKAQVMFVKNDSGSERRYFNGKLGIIQSIQGQIITVAFTDGGTTSLEKVTWEKIKYEWDDKAKKVIEKVEGTFTQYPLKLAWAITVHKSQGLSLDRVFADVSDSWDSGQVYVALSRCTTFEGLKLARPIGRDAIRVDPEVERFYEWVAKETKLQEEPPVINYFESDKTFLDKPDYIHLKWSVEGARKVVISNIGEQPVSGSILIRPKKEIIYELIATNDFGVSSIKVVHIKVSNKAPVIKKYYADREILTDNSPAELSWEIEGADKIYIEPLPGEVTGRNSIEVFTQTDQVFLLRAESYFGISVSKSLSIFVSKEPPIIEYFFSSHEYLLSDMMVELSWKTSNAAKVEISPFGGHFEGDVGLATLKIKETVIITITAYSWFGITNSKSLQIYVIPVPIIESILTPSVQFNVPLNLSIERPLITRYLDNNHTENFPWIHISEDQFVKSEIRIPTKLSAWKMPEFENIFERICTVVSKKIEELFNSK